MESNDYINEDSDLKRKSRFQTAQTKPLHPHYTTIGIVRAIRGSENVV